MKLRDRDGPLYLILIGIAAAVVALGWQHVMLVYYNLFLLGLGGLALALVLAAWRLGGQQDRINTNSGGNNKPDEAG